MVDSFYESAQVPELAASFFNRVHFFCSYSLLHSLVTIVLSTIIAPFFMNKLPCSFIVYSLFSNSNNIYTYNVISLDTRKF